MQKNNKPLSFYGFEFLSTKLMLDAICESPHKCCLRKFCQFKLNFEKDAGLWPVGNVQKAPPSDRYGCVSNTPKCSECSL